MVKHTPGPWTVRASKTTDDVGIFCGDYACLAECFSEIRERFEMAFSERDANARLIAAAPDMLEALEAVEEYLDGIADADQPAGCDHPIANEEMRLLVMVREALAKARGSHDRSHI